ncbi:uncharacterized protein LOC125310724 [Alosa alosa]|uniref:uncharacterized protein LOC125310724 n=1 Tax=Alosa alosa TaxID=278164 RepID=UPI0020152409|nr:uncharacterized protein LOC125310724 [Alosa alosa]
MDLVRIYHGLGMAYKEILRTLATQHGMVMSLSTLKRMLRANRLRRREYDDLGHIIEFILNELQGSGRLHGYRWMYCKCIEHGLRVRKEDVRIILSAVDPESTQCRRRRRLRRRQYFSRGPNFIWHIDSYDKLKPYGICINGCIDGYSRKIIWLRAAFTNSDPRVVGGYYTEAIERVGGYPRLLRTDMGTENVVLRDMQVYLRRNDEDNRAGQSSFLTGVSTANQRIESWWGVMRRQGMEHWIQMFSELKDEGLFTGDYLDKALIQLCFMGPIKDELNSIMNIWNAHRIRPSTNASVPSGVPDLMYVASHLWGADDLLVPVNADDLAMASNCMLYCGHHIWELEKLLHGLRSCFFLL